MSIVISKCGIHSIGDDRHGYGPFLQRIADADRRLSLVKCRDSFGALIEPLALWPDMPTIGAFTEFDRLPFDFAAFERRALLNSNVKYWEVLNEEDSPSTYAAKADLYISLAPLFKERGWGLCMFNCGSGNPPYPPEDGGISYAEIARACRYMIDNGYDAILGLHEYYTPSDTIGRFRVLADYLAQHGALIPIAITEWGFETNPGNDEYMALIKANDPLYMVDKRVIGYTTYTLGGSGWAASNYDTMLPQLGEYIATVAPLEPPLDDYTFSHWLMSGQTITANPLEFAMPDQDVTLVGVWTRGDAVIYRWLTIATNPAGFDDRITANVPIDQPIAVGTVVKVEAR